MRHVRQRSGSIPAVPVEPPVEPPVELSAEPTADVRRPWYQSGLPRPGTRFGKVAAFAWLPAGILIAALVVAGFVFSGLVLSTDVTLVAMGFDPDRAQLIAALIVAAVAAAVVMFTVNRAALATLLGVGALGAVYLQTFVAETQNAVAANGATGLFDPRGWIVTLITLFVIGFVVSWAGVTLAAAVRPGVISAGAAAASLARQRRFDMRLASRPIALLAVLALLVVSVPAFGDMVNFTPDVLMLSGHDNGGLVPNASVPDLNRIARPSPSTSPSLDPNAASPSPAPTPTPRVSAAPGTKPWLAWKPSGAGTVETFSMPAPWGQGKTSDIVIYTPPGYETSGMEYPVIYEAPTNYALWGTSVNTQLDYLIDNGDIPAVIMVFVSDLGAPLVPSECIDTYDGKQMMETFITKTVIDWVDDHYRAILDPRARAIMGFSAGGFCAAMLALRHPDIFNTSIAFSGYFQAGAAGYNSAKPYHDQADRDAHSPDLLAESLPESDVIKLFFIIVSAPGTDFIGEQAAYFDKILKVDAFRFKEVDSIYPHGWTEVREETPTALREWGAQLVRSGIW